MVNESHFLRLVELMNQSLDIIHDEFKRRVDNPEQHPTFIELHQEFHAIMENYPNIKTYKYDVPNYFEDINEQFNRE